MGFCGCEAFIDYERKGKERKGVRCFVDHLPVLMIGGVHRDASGSLCSLRGCEALREKCLCCQNLYTEQERCSKSIGHFDELGAGIGNHQ